MKIQGFANIYDDSHGHKFDFSVFIYALRLGAQSADPPPKKSRLIAKAIPIEINLPDEETEAVAPSGVI